MKYRSLALFLMVVWPAHTLAQSAARQPAEPAGGAAKPNRKAEIAALTEKASPIADDWESEVVSEQANQQLKELGKALETARALSEDQVAKLFTEDCRLPVLRPAEAESASVGGVEIRRWRRHSPAPTAEGVTQAFSAMLALHEQAVQMRSKFKIVSVGELSDERFVTGAIFQIFSQGPKRRVQQNATWSIEWRRRAAPEPPRIHSIELKAFDEVASKQPLFLDCTRSVITDDATWFPQLAHGGEYWYGRVDGMGEINLMGHNGIAVGDVNGDGLDDLYVAQGTGLPNKLLVQNPDGTVRDTALEAGVAWLDDTKGVLFIDFDNDGDQDLICALHHIIVFQTNDGTGRFTPRFGFEERTPSAFYSLAAADYDDDGDLDVYGCRYVEQRYGISVPVPFYDAENGPTNHLLRNDGERGFSDVTALVGLNQNNNRFSLAATWIDYDNDGDVDLAVANDFGRNNLYRNDGGKFIDIAGAAGADAPAAGMGLTWSDVDLDGDFDVYVSNMFSSAGRRIAYQPRFMDEATEDARESARHLSWGNALLVNQGDGTFRDLTDDAGVRMGRWAWGAKFIDYDNDGYDDIIVPNGFLTNESEDDL